MYLLHSRQKNLRYKEVFDFSKGFSVSFRNYASHIFFSTLFCTVFWVSKAFSSFFLTSIVAYKLFKNKYILLLRSCLCGPGGSPSTALCSSIHGTEGDQPHSEDEAQVRLQSMGNTSSRFDLNRSELQVRYCLFVYSPETQHSPLQNEKSHMHIY